MNKQIEAIEKLIALIKKESAVPITEVELSDEEGGLIRLSLKQEPTTVSAPHSATPAAIQAPSVTAASSENAKTTSSNTPAHTGTPLLAPMVGTVYLAASPGAEPFVKVGQSIKKGDTVCLIEAMKMFNKVEAECSGTVTECLIENAQAVEFNQPLFIID